MNPQESAIYNKYKDNPESSEWKQFKISSESLLKMNKTLINNCNERIKEEDTLFFVGDLGFKSGSGRGEGEPEKLQKYIEQIKCKHIYWIEGNHDLKGKNSFKTPVQNMTIKHGGKRIFLVHNPEFANTNYEINLTAHCHTAWQIKRYRKGMSFTDCVNVGVDVWDYLPCTWEEIWQRYSRWLKNEK